MHDILQVNTCQAQQKLIKNKNKDLRPNFARILTIILPE